MANGNRVFIPVAMLRVVVGKHKMFLFQLAKVIHPSISVGSQRVKQQKL